MAKLTFGNNNTGEVPGQQAAASGDASKQSRKGKSAILGSTQAQGSQVPGQNVSGKERASATEQAEGQLFKNAKDTKLATGPDYGYSRIRFHKQDEINPYADQQDARHAMDPRTRTIIIMSVALVIVFFLSATLPTSIFNASQTTGNGSLASQLASFQTMMRGFLAFMTGSTDTMYGIYVWEIIAALLAGAALGLSGGVYQGAMKNALASPSTLGVTQGGTLGIIIYGLFLYNGDYSGQISDYTQVLQNMSPLEYIVENYGEFLCALLGCFIIVGLIMLIAYIAGCGHVTNVSLVIAGQVFAAVIGVVISAIRYYLQNNSSNGNLLTLLQQAQSASFTGAYTASSMIVFAVPLLICMVLVFMMAPRLSLLAFSDDEARSMGISTRATRNLMVALCTVLTALVVSYCGMIGFVGFMVPHIARRFIGPDFRYLLPASALLGAILVTAVHYVSLLGIPGIVSGSTGTFTSIIGCIMFIVMALRSRGDKSGEWI